MSSPIHVEHALVFGTMSGEVFYKTKEWRKARYNALIHYGNRCQLCGKAPGNGVELHVDHILPRSQYPERCLDETNLQVLCNDCHIAKGIKYLDDCRGKKTQYKPIHLKEIFQITRRHLVLGIRPPKNRSEGDYIQTGVRANSKNHKKRWREFVRICFVEQISYPEAVALTIDEFSLLKSAKSGSARRFFFWSGNGIKSSSDPAFDIAEVPFPPQIIELLADDELDIAKQEVSHE